MGRRISHPARMQETFAMPKLTTPVVSDHEVKARLPAAPLVFFGLLGLALCGLIGSHSLLSFLSTAAPETALYLRADEPLALLALADREINGQGGSEAETSNPPAPSPERLRLLRGQVETALLLYPLSSQAYRLLGQIAQIEGSAAKAEKLMREAARHSLYEIPAVQYMMWKSLDSQNYPAAIFYADALLRSGNGEYAAPVLARLAEDPSATQEVKKLLSTNPSWRPGFFNILGSYVTDARTPLSLMLSLRDTRAPPTEAELSAYEAFLFGHKLYQLAYYVWLQFLPPEKLEFAGLLFDGDFEVKPSGSPFDWRAPAGTNVIVDLAPRPDGAAGHALLVELGPGRVEFPGVSQAVILTPGAYSLKGSVLGELSGRRGVQWGISCLDGPMLAQSPLMLGSLPDWREFEFTFAVPETGCPAQSLQLKLAARSPSEQLISGEIWFDALSITRDERRIRDKAQNEQTSPALRPGGVRPSLGR